MRVRLIWAILSSLLEEAALAAVVLLWLPRWDMRLPLWGLILLMLALAAYNVVTYRMGSRALRKKPVPGLLDLVGSKGRAVSRLNPSGVIRIGGEVWQASSDSDTIDVGEEVVVVEQEGLKLVVHQVKSADIEEG